MNTIQTSRDQRQRPQTDHYTYRYTSATRLDPTLESAKSSIRQEFRHSPIASEHLLDLALKEAEALAWETGFPHLVFPALAKEKLEALTAWQARQRSLLQPDCERCFAA